MKEQITLFRKVSLICTLSILQLIAGCSSNSKINYTYELSLIEEEIMGIDNAQYYESYNRMIPYVTYEFLENDYVNDIEYNLISLSDYSTKPLNLNVPDNYRVISLVVFESQNFVYSMIDQSGLNEDSLFHYQVVRQNIAGTEVIAEGNASGVLNAPIFAVFENNVYFLLTSLDYSTDSSSGDYRVEFWKIGYDDASMLNQSIGEYSDYFLNENTEYHFQRVPNVSESAVSYLSKIGNDMYLNRYSDNSFQQLKLNKNYNYVIPINKNGYLCGVTNLNFDDSINVDAFYFDWKSNNYAEIQFNNHFVDWVSLSNGIIIGIDNNGIGWFVNVKSPEIILEKIEVNNPIYFRKISDEEIFIFAYDDSWAVYKLRIVPED